MSRIIALMGYLKSIALELEMAVLKTKLVAQKIKHHAVAPRRQTKNLAELNAPVKKPSVIRVALAQKLLLRTPLHPQANQNNLVYPAKPRDFSRLFLWSFGGVTSLIFGSLMMLSA